MKANYKKYAHNCTVTILEMGGGIIRMPEQIGQQRSVFANEPRNFSEGMHRAGEDFVKNMKTVVTFAADENADLLSLPMVMIRPFTNSISDIFLGICNQMNPERYKEIQEKYK